MKSPWWLFLQNGAFFIAGCYLFSQSGMREMLFGTGLMLYGSIGWAIDSLAMLVNEIVELDIDKRLDKLESQLEKITALN